MNMDSFACISFFNRDASNGLLESPYNFIILDSIYPKQPGPFGSSFSGKYIIPGDHYRSQKNMRPNKKRFAIYDNLWLFVMDFSTSTLLQRKEKQKQKLLKKERLQNRMTHDKNDSQNNNTPHPEIVFSRLFKMCHDFCPFSINSKFFFAKIPWIRYHDHWFPVPGVRFLGRRYIHSPIDGFRQLVAGHGLSPSFWTFRRKTKTA